MGAAGDPIALATGALRISFVDLSYAGPVRPLEFVRRYHSRSDERGILGSNWSHNYADYLTVVSTADKTAPNVCRHEAGTCVWHKDGTVSTLYGKIAGQGFYISLTRSDATLHPSATGWTLVEPDGHQLIFDNTGYLAEDRDRFGNGFKIALEETPLFRLYRRWCLGNGPTEHPNEDPRVCAALAYAFGDGPPASWLTWKLPDEESTVPLVQKKCIYEMRPDPRHGHDCTNVDGEGLIAEFGLLTIFGQYHAQQCGNNDPRFGTYHDYLTLQLDLFNDAIFEANNNCKFTYTVCEGWPEKYRDPVERSGYLTSWKPLSNCVANSQPWTEFSGKLAWPVPTEEHVIVVPDGVLYEKVALPEEPSYEDVQAIHAFLAAGYVDLEGYGRSHGMFYTPKSVYGETRYRPIVVTDNIGRSLTFTYSDPHTYPQIGAQFGLLKSVRGPGGKTIQFRYEQPADYPARLNELFLPHVGAFSGGVDIPGVRYATTPEGVTIDGVAVDYVYDWPGPGGGSYAEFLFDLWQAHIKTSYGRRRASVDALRYIETIADNIRGIVRNRPLNETIELETQYYRHPADASVDHVMAQRFGSGPPQPYNGWSLSAPRLSLRYLHANPNLAYGDVVTDPPAEIRQRYPIENVPSAFPDYYPSQTEVRADTELHRTPLACANIAMRARDLWLNTADSDLANLREALRRDGSRICAWTRLEDRDGTVRWFGFNAFGDTLVDAVREADDNRFIFTERVMDEDGRVLADRAPSSRLVAGWQPYEGATLNTYRGYTSLDGERWRARGNLIRRVEIPVGGSVFNLRGGDLASTDTSLAAGRLTRFAYEPAFNQIGRIQWGTTAASGSEKIDYELVHTYEGQCSSNVTISWCITHFCGVKSDDFSKLRDAQLHNTADDLQQCWAQKKVPCVKPRQRLAEKVDAFSRLAMEMRGSASQEASKQLSEWTTELQMRDKHVPAEPRAFAGGRDQEVALILKLAGELLIRLRPNLPDWQDGIANSCGHKRPTTLTFRQPDRPEGARITDLQWNDAGLPTRIHEWKGATTKFEYFNSVLVGGPAPPTLLSTSVSSSNRGLLARVTLSRFDEDYGAIFDREPCDVGNGPYRWLLSPNCALRETIA